MNVFIRAMVRIFSFGERWNVPFNSAVASLNGTFHLSPHENILTIAHINIHYLYNDAGSSLDEFAAYLREDYARVCVFLRTSHLPVIQTEQTQKAVSIFHKYGLLLCIYFLTFG
jgi:hypothetical protein